MKTFVFVMLLLFSSSLSATELAEPCLDCHEFAFDFEDVADVNEMNQLIAERSTKHKATVGLTAEDIKVLAEYIMAEVTAK